MKLPIPARMQAVLLEGVGGALSVGQVPVPEPGPGQVLIRMAASPVNPSDLGFMGGSYGFQKPFPVVPGMEGSGTVAAAGPGLLPRLWLGRRVACAGSPAAGGAWAEYRLTQASACFPLAPGLSLEQGAALIVNPMTALAFLDIARRGRHAAIVNNAAASALGRMILRLGRARRLPVIHVVRRKEQAELLRSLGGEHILNSSDPGFADQLRSLAGSLKATLVLDPVAGEGARQLLEAAPGGSTLLIYGTLSGRKVDPVALASGFTDKRVEDFFLADWVARKSLPQVLWDAWRVQRLAANELQTAIQQRFPLAAVQAAIDLYRANPTAGKVLLTMQGE